MRFNALVDRFSYIIRGQFYGHTHADQISFFPDMKSLEKIDNVSISNYYLVAPSLTTYGDRVPEYRILDIDFDTLQILDFKQYKLDLSKFKTKEQKPFFELFYTFKEAYGIDDMTIDGGITDLRNKLRDDPEIQKIYSHNQCGGKCEG